MYPALQIANQIIEKAIDGSNLLTHLKLQKTIYLAHGLNLAKTGEPLIAEFFEPWKFGPVVRPVYDTYKDFGGDAINRLTAGVSIGNLSADEDAKNAINDAWYIAKNLDAITLSNWTHAPNSPWKKAIDSGKLYISNEDLEEYFMTVFKISRLENAS